MKGKLKEEVGKRGADPSLEAEGRKDRARGKVKEAWEETKDALEKGKEALKNR
ncbi:MAG TPA: CsbD family protein [Actinomycetota bacterium]|nr:CsbD family protein [Actinomycetota bacterium]